jgi:hypothetical protein
LRRFTRCGGFTMAATESQVDASVTGDGGSLFLVHPLSDAAKQWIEENVQEDAQWFGRYLVVEHRFIRNLVTGMLEAGLEVQ